jgi:tetratricopeptide (TPR) repeat protein
VTIFCALFIMVCLLGSLPPRSAAEPINRVAQSGRLPSYYLTQVDALRRKGDHRKILKVLNAGLEDNPGNSDLLRSRFGVYKDLKEYSNALEDYKLIIAVPGLSDLAKVGWTFLKAQVEFESGDFEQTIRDCNDCINAQTNPNQLAAFFLKSEALSSLGRLEESRKVFDRGTYFGASEYADLAQHNFWMTRAAKPLGLVGTFNQAGPRYFTNGFKVDEPKPRTANASALLGTVIELANMKPPTTGAELESKLELKFHTGRKTKDLPEHAIGGPTTQWRRVEITNRKASPFSNELNLQPDLFYACVFPADVIDRLGSPDIRQGYISHSDATAMDYTRPDYHLTFTFCHSGFKALNNVRIHWITQDEKNAVRAAKEARLKREALGGSRSTELLDWMRQLFDMRTPISLAAAEKMFGQNLNPLREKEPKTWTLGVTQPRFNGPVRNVDFTLAYMPKGSIFTDAQLRLSPGRETHLLKRTQLETEFGAGTIISGTALDPRPKLKRYTCLSFKNDNGSMTAVCDNSDSAGIVEDVIFWWRGTNPEQCFEEYERKRTSSVLLGEAREALQRHNFDLARILLDAAMHRIEEENYAKRSELYEKYVQVRTGYLNLFKAMKLEKEVAYLEQVSCAQLLSDLSENDSTDIDGESFPNMDDTSKSKWEVQVSPGGCFLSRKGIGQIGSGSPEGEKALRKLFGSGTDGTKELNRVPADLVDALYFDFAIK